MFNFHKRFESSLFLAARIIPNKMKKIQSIFLQQIFAMNLLKSTTMRTNLTILAVVTKGSCIKFEGKTTRSSTLVQVK